MNHTTSQPQPNDDQHVFAVYCYAKETSAYDKSIIVKEDEGFWVINEPDGWVEATATRGEITCPPKDVKTWKTVKGAEAFAKKWKGHPWYYVPKTWKIVKLRKVMKTVFSHYACAA